MTTSPWSPLGIVEQVEELDSATLNTYAIAGNNITFERSAERNYTPNGNVTVNDSGVASGFTSRTDYLKVNYQFAPGSSPWVMHWKVKTGTNRPSHSYDMYAIQSSAWSNQDCRHVQIVENSGKWQMALSSNGSSWDIAGTYGTYAVQENTVYWLMIEFTGTNYIFSYSLDGVNWVEDINITSSTPIYQQTGTNNYAALGSALQTNIDFSWCGDIYLEECYYEIAGNEVWRAYVDSGKYTINASSPTYNSGTKTITL